MVVLNKICIILTRFIHEHKKLLTIAPLMARCIFLFKLETAVPLGGAVKNPSLSTKRLFSQKSPI